MKAHHNNKSLLKLFNKFKSNRVVNREKAEVYMDEHAFNSYN